MAEINLLNTYPNINRDVEGRFKLITDEHHKIARQFGKEFFDGPRSQGYGGYYDWKRWTPVAKRIIDYYGLKPGMSIFDVGCAKGFALFGFLQNIPTLKVAGIDVSQYAIENSPESVKPFLKVANAKELPFPDNSFDLIISINTIHNLNLEDCKKAVQEIERVKRKYAFITVDAYRNEEERKNLEMWNLTAKTILSVDDWKKLFDAVGYTGDYYWGVP